MTTQLSLAQDLVLVARTSEASPLVLGTTTDLARHGIRLAIDAYFRNQRERQELIRLWRRHFPSSRNADVVVGTKSNDADYTAASTILETIVSSFDHKPRRETAKAFSPGEKPDLSRDLVSIGGPTRNGLAAWYFSNETHLPHYFDIYEENQRTLCRVLARGEKRVPYEPHRIYVPEEQQYTYKEDYAVVVRAPWKIALGTAGVMLVIAGCHGGGTVGAAQAITDGSILSQIDREVGPVPFEAVIHVDIHWEGREHPSPYAYELVEVESFQPSVTSVPGSAA